MELYFQRYPEGVDVSADSRPPVIVIPGLFGSTTNWRSFARKFGEQYPIMVVDQRNHGRSPQFDSHSYADMVGDLLEFIDQLQLEQVILAGHSMGGKTAMVFGLLHPERLAKLAVLDIAPVKYEHSHAPFLQALLEIDLSNLASRGEADRALQAAIPDLGTRLFLLQSLTGSAGAYSWRLNLKTLHDYMPEIVGFPDQSVAGFMFEPPCAFIYGEVSDYLQSKHRSQVEKYFANAQYVGIPGAGHWLHVDQPDLVRAALLNFVINGEKDE